MLLSASAKAAFSPVESGNYIYGIPERVTPAILKENYTRMNYVLMNLESVTPAANDPNYIGTGYKIRYESGIGTYKTLTVIVKGELTGNGVINASDYLLLKTAIMGTTVLSEANTIAADLNGDGDLSSNDYIKIKMHFYGKYDIHSDELVIPSEDTSSTGGSSSKEPWTPGWV